MYFKDIIGQDKIKSQLKHYVEDNRIPHALLLAGPEGTGKLAMAIAFARYVCCSNRGKDDACGTCPSCQKFNKIAHPDLHFAFPIYKTKSAGEATCDQFMKAWREQLLKDPYFNYHQWMEFIGSENAQGQIYEKESTEILRKLSLKAYESDYKIMIIWLPEKMNPNCSNKLLKVIEEPPKDTLFLLVSEEPEKIIPTILSRTQRVEVPRIAREDMEKGLSARYGLTFEDAALIAQQSAGDWEKAEELLSLSDEKAQYLDLFMQLMRVAYARNIRDMKAWSEQVAALGRERQKRLLDYCQRMIRENFIMNFRNDEMLYMSQAERNFSVRFSPFVNENNIFGIVEELSEAQRHIEQNVNAKMVFFDMSLRMIVWIKNR